MDEKLACFLLTSAESIGAKTIDKLRLAAGSLNEALGIDPMLLKGAGLLSKAQAEELRRVLSEKERYIMSYERALNEGVNIYIKEGEGYPERLKYIPDAPAILFVKGELPRDDEPSAAIVGARAASEYGIAAAEFFAGELSRSGVDIVSGLAYGIDSAAAKGALKAGGRSFAVLGSGVDICYPPRNYPLYLEMADKGGGGIISEFHPGREPLGKHFVMRNRIIAGLSDVLLVIEARVKSGTSLTVDYALSQGKEVFAMPGRINDPLGQGCNRLLKEGATPLTEPGDVLMSLKLDSLKARRTIDEKRDVSRLTPGERRLYEALDLNPLHVEDIARRAGMDLRTTISLLYALELKGFAMQTVSAYYRRC